MTFLFYCTEFPPQAGGVGSYMYNMACALRGAGHECVVVTSRVPGLPDEESSGCGTVYRLYNAADKYAARTTDDVLAVARNHGVDLVEGADHHGESAALLARRDRPPVLIKVHGSNPVKVLQRSQVYYPWQHVTTGVARLRNLGQTLREQRSIERADLVLFPSRRMQEEVLAQGLEIPSRHGVVPNPIKVEDFGETVEKSSAPTLLFVGRFDMGKGLAYLPDLVRRVAEKVPGAVLELAGGDSFARGLGSMKDWLVRRSGRQVEAMRFLGPLDREALQRAYHRAWALVLPSRWDNFPTVLLEAMAAGLPAVTSPYGGMPEMLEGTPCRSLDPASPEFAQEACRLLTDAEHREAAGKAVKSRVLLAFAPEIVVEKYLRFIHDAPL